MFWCDDIQRHFQRGEGRLRVGSRRPTMFWFWCIDQAHGTLIPDLFSLFLHFIFIHWRERVMVDLFLSNLCIIPQKKECSQWLALKINFNITILYVEIHFDSYLTDIAWHLCYHKSIWLACHEKNLSKYNTKYLMKVCYTSWLRKNNG